MKKLLFLLFLVTALSIRAQVNFGISGGVNTGLRGKSGDFFGSTEIYKPIMGWGVNLIGEYRINQQYGAQLEIGVQQIGFQSSKRFLFATDFIFGNENGSIWKLRERYRYWNSTLLLEAFPFSNHPSFVVRLGTSLGFKLQGWRITDGAEASFPVYDKEPIELESNDMAIAACIAFGENIHLKGKHFMTLELRYNHSLDGFQSLEIFDPLQLSLGYKFGK